MISERLIVTAKVLGDCQWFYWSVYMISLKLKEELVMF